MLFIENIGNLVCPAGFDLGEAHKVVVLSVTEGEDKPLKYPNMFAAADLLLLNKTDLLPHLDFDVEQCLEYARRINPDLIVLRLSARTGEGVADWLDWLRTERRAVLRRQVKKLEARLAEVRLGWKHERLTGVAMADSVRLAIRVRGQVQGVGFRPFVYRLACDLKLRGWVRNDAAGVAIEAQGPAAALEQFLAALRQPPPLARIDELRTTALPARGGEEGFVIHASHAGPVLAEITPDTAVCAAFFQLFDPADRRYRYAFINCTHCGPRYTITRALPYDRPNTSMASFPLCPDCAREYHDPPAAVFMRNRWPARSAGRV